MNLPTANYLSVPKLMNSIFTEVEKKHADVISLSARVHSRFEQIHPFSEGNDRVGRLLMHAILLKYNLAPAGLNIC